MNNTHDPSQANPEIWGTFASDPTTGLAILSSEGLIEYLNPQSVRIFFDDDRDPSTVIGKTIFEIGFPQAWANERIALVRDIISTGKRRLLRTVWNGRQQFSWMSPIGGDEESPGDRVLVVTRRIPTTHEQEFLLGDEIEVVHSGVICLGDLSALTPRELEVLALLGQGLSIKDIAATLHRSVKTIENHRESIGRKLKRTRGVELAGIAQSAGLMVEDSKRQRMEKRADGGC